MIARRAALLALLLACGCDRKKPPPPEPSPPAGAEAEPTVSASASEELEAPEVTVRAQGSTVHVVWSVPAGTGVNEDAPFKVRWSRSEGLEAPAEMRSTGAKVKDGFDVPVKPFAGAPRATLGGIMDLVVCDTATHKVCVPVKRKLDLGFLVTKDAPAETMLVVNLPEARIR